MRTHIAHFFEAHQWETCNQRLFRDWLRAHPDDRVRYERVNRAAAAALGLPLVDVWDT